MRPERYKWLVVALLWFVCLFNYADRQAIFSVFTPLKAEMHLSDIQLGVIGSAFMWVYAAALPLAGPIGDRCSRKGLIVGGLIFWSLITLATALATRYWQLVAFRALEGLGEAFYYPASMSLIGDYHGRQTRSRAMALHQSSVYAGTIAGGAVAGYFGQYHGWRIGFLLFGGLGIALGAVLIGLLREPVRGKAEGDKPPEVSDELPEPPEPLVDVVVGLARSPLVVLLTAVFAGANFVAVIFLTWMPTYLTRTFKMDLAMAGLNATAWLQIASVLGVLAGGALADRWSSRWRSGRIRTQAVGLLVGVPFLVAIGRTREVSILVLALIGFGLAKGFYDANIWASLCDVVAPRQRATAVGLMNAIGWLGGSIAPPLIAAASTRFGMGPCLGATSAVYLLAGLGLVLGAVAVDRPRAPAPTLPVN